MPASYVVRGRAARAYEGPDRFGPWLRAWLQGQLKRLDVGFARSLGEAGEPEPFTLSPLRGESVRTSAGGVRIRAGAACWFRWTALEPRAEALSDAIARGIPGERLALGPLDLDVEAILTREAEDAWAGRAGYEDIWDRNVGREETRLVLRFESPTLFRLEGGARPLPEPELVFRSLLERWQRWSPVDLAGLEGGLTGRVDLAFFHVESRRMEGSRRAETGFVGTVGLSLGRLDPLVRGAVHALGAYAFYAGVGAMTGLGFGQARPVRAAAALAASSRPPGASDVLAQARAREGSPVVGVRYALEGPGLPPVEEAVMVADRVRRAVMGLYGRAHGGEVSPTLSGRDGSRPARGHRHAFYLPVDEDGDGRVDHLWIFAPAGFGEAEMEALARLRELRWSARSDDAPMRLGPPDPIRRWQLEAADGSRDAGFAGVAGPSRRWLSATPYVLTRHPKLDHRGRPRRNPDGTQRDGPEDQVLREWEERREHDPRLPPLRRVETLPAVPEAWAVFRLARPGGGRSAGLAVGLSLEFAEPVTGPLAFGYGCHYGLGLFRAADGEEVLGEIASN